MKKLILIGIVSAIVICGTSCGIVRNIIDNNIKDENLSVAGVVVVDDSTENADNSVSDTQEDREPDTQSEDLPAQVDFMDYLGDWGGEAELNVYMPNKNIVELSFRQSNYNASRYAYVETALPVSSFDGNKVSFAFVDSWYNTGNMTIVFGNKVIECTVSDVEYAEDALFGVTNGFYPLVRMYNAAEQDDPEVYIENEYILDTHLRYISRDELVGYSKETVALIRNEIYARHGYVFKNNEYKTYFNQQSWYVPNPNYNVNMLSDVEKYNVSVITEYEKDMGWK